MQTQLSLRDSQSSFDVGAEAYWYAAYTCPNHEKKVAEQLDRRSIEQLLPVYYSVRQWKDRKVRLARPLFPGYVFVRIPRNSDCESWKFPALRGWLVLETNPHDCRMRTSGPFNVAWLAKSALNPIRILASAGECG